MSNNFRFIALFAGIGGIRIPFEELGGECVFSSEWDKYSQMTYEANFGERPKGDITKIKAEDIPKHDLLVGGFPCQDYSVAKQMSKSKGIEGKKGVLWWDIRNILEVKRPKYILLENVDRLIKSPAKQRGRDFAIILASLSDLGYMAEWRVINAADYGMPQRRRRVFIFAAHKKTNIYKNLNNIEEWVLKKGIFAKAFKVKKTQNKQLTLFGNLDFTICFLTAEPGNFPSTGLNESNIASYLS